MTCWIVCQPFQVLEVGPDFAPTNCTPTKGTTILDAVVLAANVAFSLGLRVEGLSPRIGLEDIAGWLNGPTLGEPDFVGFASAMSAERIFTKLSSI
jgi:hypothetical protein